MDKDNQRGEPCCRDLLGAVYLYDPEDLPPVLQTSKSCGFWSYIHFTHGAEQMIKSGSSGLHSLQISQSSAVCNAAALKMKHDRVTHQYLPLLKDGWHCDAWQTILTVNCKDILYYVSAV